MMNSTLYLDNDQATKEYIDLITYDEIRSFLLGDVKMNYKYNVGEKVVIIDNSDDEQYPIGAICTIESRSVRIYVNRNWRTINIYRITEFPEANFIEEQRLDYPSRERRVISDSEFDDMFR